jgi:hypothetical protein
MIFYYNEKRLAVVPFLRTATSLHAAAGATALRLRQRLD